MVCNYMRPRFSKITHEELARMYVDVEIFLSRLSLNRRICLVPTVCRVFFFFIGSSAIAQVCREPTEMDSVIKSKSANVTVCSVPRKRNSAITKNSAMSHLSPVPSRTYSAKYGLMGPTTGQATAVLSLPSFH